MVNPSSAAGSPVTFPMNGHFSEEDIHELLGAMGNDQHHDHASLDHFHLEAQEAVVSAASAPGSSDEPPATTTTSSTAVACKHHEQQEEDEEEEISAEARAQARSERKRSREKQRRLDVNKQFADLTQLLRRIEAEDLDAEGMAGFGSIPTSGPTNRVDLIARTIAVLERMHDMSCKRRRDVVELTRQLDEMKKMAEDTAARLKEATAYQQGTPKPVMMMVPMMVNPGAPAAAAAPGATTAAAPGFPFASPFMQQAQPQMFMPQMAPAVPAPAVAGATTNTATSASAVMPTAQVAQQHATVATQVPPQHQSLVMPQQPVVFPTPQVMFGGATPSPPPAATTQSQASSPQQQPKQPPANVNGGGGNLAHCA